MKRTGLLLVSLLITLSSFGNVLPNARDFFIKNPKIEETLNSYLTKNESLQAMAIVAPEIDEYSNLSDKVETYSLMYMYSQFGRGNFSIGYFQMKPTFAESIENSIKVNATLKDKYKELIIYEDTAQAERAERIQRLASLKYQTIYLAAFFELGSSKIKNWTSNNKNNYQRLRNLATLYNGGLNLSETTVLELQKKKQFPSMGLNKHNYSDLVVDFFRYYFER